MIIEEVVNRGLTVAAIWILTVSAAVYLFIFEPGKSGFFLNCPFLMLTGFTCPGCGSTRGVHSLLHGDVIGAFQFNPMMFLLIPILLFVLVRHTVAVFRSRPVRGNQVKAAYIWLFFVVVMSFWIVRNTPFYPFS